MNQSIAQRVTGILSLVSGAAALLTASAAVLGDRLFAYFFFPHGIAASSIGIIGGADGPTMSMTLFFSFIFLRFVFENNNLIAFSMSNNFCFTYSTFNKRISSNNFAIITNKQYFKVYFITYSICKFFNSNNIIFIYSILLSTTLNYCKHLYLPPLTKLAALQVLLFNQ